MLQCRALQQECDEFCTGVLAQFFEGALGSVESTFQDRDFAHSSKFPNADYPLNNPQQGYSKHELGW
jgi:hypothetical protein